LLGNTTFIYYSQLLNDYSLILKMIPKNTASIIMYLLRNIDEFGYNINQLATLNKISVGSAFKILKDLEKDKIVVKKEISNASHYKLHFKNLEAIKLCELLLLAEKRHLTSHAKIYADEIVIFKDAEMIILFGSVLKGKEYNDVDVLFLTNQTKKVHNFCLEISKIRTKPVVPLIMRKQDLIKAIKNKKEAILGIMKEGVVLKGESKFVGIIKNVNS
jgi:predicted nucleotidyltransferase